MNQILLLLYVAACVHAHITSLGAAKEKATQKSDKEIHLKLTQNELQRVFGVDDPSQVPSYEVVYPSLVDQNARRSTRARRSLHDKIPMFMHFKAFDTDFHLNMTKNKDIAPDIQFIEHHNDEGITRLKGRSATHSIGKIASDENSIVALDHLNGLNGQIMNKEDTFAIAPIPFRLSNRRRTADSFGAHIVFKKSALPVSHLNKRSTCGVDNHVQNMKETWSRKRRSTSSRPEKTMELMIAADKHMVAFHGKEFLQSYLLTHGNMVAGLFKDKSLAYPITVIVTRIVIFENDVFANVTKILDLMWKFTSWAMENNPVDDSDPLHVDNAVLLTRIRCTDDCGTAGIATIGMCGRRSSYSVVRDSRLMSSLVTAHEIGHNLGVGHDGGKCPGGVNLMSASSMSGSGSFEWSNCSSEALRANLESSSSWCFNDKPTTNNYPMNSSFQMYGLVYDGDKQCQIAFGSDFVLSRSLARMRCGDLACKRPSELLTYFTVSPPAHGTWCGDRMWCIHGECVMDGTTPAPPIDGGWSSFSTYTKCNRACGGGVQWRERTCTNPAPQGAGKNCVGDSKSFWKTCNMQPCSAGTDSYRAEQCKANPPYIYYTIDYRSVCLLICGNSHGKLGRYGVVQDGTLATETGPDVCIQGVRRKVGCDLALESGAILDRCGICGGDGSTCLPVTFINMNAYTGLGLYEVGIIPAGSSNILIKELHPTKNYIGIKVGTSNNLAFHLPTWSTSLKVAGAHLVYIMEAYIFPDQIKITGVIDTQIRIIFVNHYYESSKGIEWTYYKPADGNISTTEYVAPDAWESCSKTCAGGKQTRQLICRRVDDKTHVSISFCSSLVKPATEQPCNTQACPPQWHYSEWSSCSKSCATGQKTRNLTCSELRADQKYYPVKTESLCTSAKPDHSLIANCNEVMCPSKWIIGSWNQCNATCGQGIQTRDIHCERTDRYEKKTVVRDLECSYVQKPVQQVECNFDNPCPIWNIEYRACSKSCDGGLKYPYLECRVPGSMIKLDDSQCSIDKKPDLSKIAPKSCNTHICLRYEWKSSEGICSVSCGTGTIPMTIICHRNTDNVTVADKYCMNTTKPSSYKPCDAGDCPEIYKWKIVKGSCSVTCGNGTIQAKVVCYRERDAKIVDNILCEASIKPTVNAPTACTLNQCPEVYIWNVTYGACSVSCSTGTRQPIIKCVKQSDVQHVADESLCSAPRPQPGQISCDLGACPPAYSWRELWTKCNVTCGMGHKTSNYKCFMDGTSTEMDDSYCKALAKPKGTTMQCSIVCNYEWVAVHGECVATCGLGYKMMKLSCQHIINKTVASHSKCIEERIPVPSHQQCPHLPACSQNSSISNDRGYYNVGCFRDNLDYRRIPFYVRDLRNQIINWLDLSPIIDSCAKIVKLPETSTRFGFELPFFAIQFYGECWAGDASSEKKYYLSGSSTNCYLGTGGTRTNFIYHFRSARRISQMDPILSVGCFNDDGSMPKPLPILTDNFEDVISTNKTVSDNMAMIIKKCALAAARRDFTHFGIQADGKCWSGANASNTYNEDGESTACKNGVGGPSSIFVYQFLKTTY